MFCLTEIRLSLTENISDYSFEVTLFLRSVTADLSWFLIAESLITIDYDLRCYLTYEDADYSCYYSI